MQWIVAIARLVGPAPLGLNSCGDWHEPCSPWPSHLTLFLLGNLIISTDIQWYPLISSDIHWYPVISKVSKVFCSAKLRYRTSPQFGAENFIAESELPRSKTPVVKGPSKHPEDSELVGTRGKKKLWTLKENDLGTNVLRYFFADQMLPSKLEAFFMGVWIGVIIMLSSAPWLEQLLEIIGYAEQEEQINQITQQRVSQSAKYRGLMLPAVYRILVEYTL